MKQRSKNPAEVMRKKCVELAKQIVRRQQNYTCEYSGQKEPQIRTHGSHIYSEGVYRSMSADLDNILCLAAVHHLAHSYWNKANKWSWHGTPLEAIEWFKEKYPARYKTLKQRARKSVQADEMFWTKKLVELKKIWDLLLIKEKDKIKDDF